ncbi:DUF3313 family protein [Parvularcula sp. LCG005]|uniref:DUF3313 family protein n=1 Tax=Parvularcula sp. LCG005 TaxID=3078805 RepID=UPI002942E766|nr:DUF3313 family protein [Parvularcula sp. LCG005]WOI53746.1 DUF3313 family protein [Parvularcula sp. LCG005]
MSIRAILIGGLVATLAACASAPVGPESTGRFDDFTVAAGGTADFTGYDMVFLAPIAVSDDLMERVGYQPRSLRDDIRPLSERELNAKVAQFDEQLRAKLGPVATLTDGPGLGVLTIEVTLTDLEANRPTQAELAASPGLSYESRAAGGASADVAFYEGERLLATARDTEVGTMRIDEIPGSTWYEANQFFARFASKVAGLLG